MIGSLQVFSKTAWIDGNVSNWIGMLLCWESTFHFSSSLPGQNDIPLKELFLKVRLWCHARHTTVFATWLMKFPLPVDYFECPPLSPEECEQYEQQAVQNAREMLEKAVITNSQYQWKRIADEAEVEIFRGKDPSTPATATLHCATIDLACTLEEVAHFYRNDTTEEFKEMVRRTGHGMVDAANLYWVHRSAEAKVRIQWILVKTPFDGVVKKRDFCVLE
ncbi:unnamed protein product, partial [Aphanomyces euteiches]